MRDGLEPINQNEPQVSISVLSVSFQFLENNCKQALFFVWHFEGCCSSFLNVRLCCILLWSNGRIWGLWTFLRCEWSLRHLAAWWTFLQLDGRFLVWCTLLDLDDALGVWCTFSLELDGHRSIVWCTLSRSGWPFCTLMHVSGEWMGLYILWCTFWGRGWPFSLG